MSDNELKRGIRILISGGMGQLDNSELSALGKAIITEGIKRRVGLREYEKNCRFLIELETQDVLMVTSNGTCAKCKKWPGSDR